MARKSWSDRIEALDAPANTMEGEAIWTSVRPLFVLGRIGMILAIIATGELFDDVFYRGLSPGVWGLILGIPAFVLISMFIAYIDHRTGWEEHKEQPKASDKDEG